MTRSRSNGRQSGTLHEFESGDWLADIEFFVERSGRGDASGRIWIGTDPHPAVRFRGDSTLVGQQKSFLLVTETGVKIEICFTNSNGAFACVVADEVLNAIQG